MRCLIVFSSTEGQTEKIACAIGERCREQGHEVTVQGVGAEPPSLASFDRVIVGGSIHVNRHQRDLARFVTKHLEALRSHQATAFFSVSLSASGDETDRAAARALLDRFLAKQGWQPRHQTIVAGAVRWGRYGFFKRLLMRQILKRKDPSADLSQDLEYTDWDEVRSLADEVLDG